MVTEAQMPLIVDACERPIRTFNSGSCPLCEDWKPMSANNNAKGFSRHLARHLQQLSLASIPISTPGLEIKMSDDASDVGGRSSMESIDKEDLQKNALARGNSALLFLAAKNGDQDMITSLLKTGVDVNMTDEKGITPLSWAAKNGHSAVVRILLRSGADIGANDAKTFLTLAALEDNGGPIVSAQATSSSTILDDTNRWLKNRLAEVELQPQPYRLHRQTFGQQVEQSEILSQQGELLLE